MFYKTYRFREPKYTIKWDVISGNMFVKAIQKGERIAEEEETYEVKSLVSSSATPNVRFLRVKSEMEMSSSARNPETVPET